MSQQQKQTRGKVTYTAPQGKKANEARKRVQRAREVRKYRQFYTPNVEQLTKEAYSLTSKRIQQQIPDHPGMYLTKQMMLPFEVPVHRLPTTDMPRCAVTRIRYTNEFTERDVAGAFTGATYLAMVIGQPGLTYMDGPWTFTNSKYVCKFYNTGGVDLDYWVLDGFGYAAGDWAVTAFWPLGGDKYSSGTVRAGLEAQPVLSTSQTNWIWCNTGETITIKGTGVGTTDASLSINVYQQTGAQVDNPDIISTTSINLNGTAVNYVIGQAAWICLQANEFTVVTGTLTAVNIEVSHSITSSACWALHYATDITDDPSIGRECRRTAATLLVTNTASQFNAQGDVYGARVQPPAMTNNVFPLTRFENAADKYTGWARDGAYTYMEFTREDEEFRSFITTSSYPRCYLPDNMVNCIRITNGAVLNNPNTFLTTFDIVLEFKTSSQRYPLTVSSSDPVLLFECRRVNNTIPYFYSNKFHWKDIARMASSAISALRTHAIPVSKALSVAFPEYSPLLMTAGRAMSR